MRIERGCTRFQSDVAGLGLMLYPQARLSTHILIPASELESQNEAPKFRACPIIRYFAKYDA